MAKNIIALGIVIGFSILAGLPLLHPGLHPTHDGEYHVIRFYEFDKVLRDGSIYPRWAPDLNNGYGVPLFNYVYPLPNYVASFLHILGASFIDAFKLQMLIASLIGSLFFYLWTKRYWGVTGGVVSSIFYTFTPYRFVDIYVRGSVGEVWAISLFPALLYMTDKYFEKNNPFHFTFSVVLLSLIVLSHNILGLLFFIVYLTYMSYINFDKKKWLRNLRNFIAIILLALGISSIFWLPAIIEEKFVSGLQIYNIAQNFPELYQLIFPSWGTGFFNSENLGSQMSVQIGIANIFGVIIGSVALLRHSVERKMKKYVLFFLIWFAVSSLLMLRVSQPIWENLPFMRYFQFPWRMLSIIVIIAPFLAGSITLLTKQKILEILIIILAFVSAINYTKPAYYHDRKDEYYIMRNNFIHGTNSPGNLFNTIWMKNVLPIGEKKAFVTKGKGEVSVIQKTSTEIILSSKTLESSRLSVSRVYFPGWNAYVNGQSLKVDPDEFGLVTFSVPAGSHAIKVSFGDTLVRKLATAISLISITILALFLLRRYLRI